MISPRLQIVAVAASVLFLIMMVYMLKKNRLALKYSLLWLFSGIVMLVLSLFPQVLDSVSELVGVYSSVNALFAVMLLCGLILMISFTMIISREKAEIVRLTQEVAILENRLDKLEGRMEEKA